MLLLMQAAGTRQLKIQTVSFIRLELSLEMFVKVLCHFSNEPTLLLATEKSKSPLFTDK